MNLLNQPKNPYLLFIGTVMMGVFITIICSMLLLIPYLSDIANHSLNMMLLPREKLISLQVANMLGLFIFPPILYALFSKNEFLHTFNLDKKIEIKHCLYAFLLALGLFPVLINIQYIITQLPLPEAIKHSAEIQKLANEKILSLFLDFPGIPNLVLMVLIIGIGAGLTEELFFRGLLMPLIARITKSQWTGIVLSGVIFSAFHANLYDFIPIVMVGMLLGYIYTATGDLKLNIFLHATYNSFQVVLNYLFNNKMLSFDIDKLEYVPIYVFVVCLAVCAIFVKLITKKNEHISH